MLAFNGKEVFAGMSRKQIEERGGFELLKAANESLQPQTHKKAYGFSITDRATLKEVK